LKRHVVLVGLPGSGKTTTGRLTAATLGAPFVDVDDEIVRKAGMDVPEVFEREGESGFRAHEAAAMEAALAGPAAVIAPGGGWAAAPGRLEGLRGRAYSIYLKTDAATAAQRTVTETGRPLVSSVDPVGSLHTLLERREGFYRRADATVVTDGKTPAEVSGQVAELARRNAGW